MAWVCFFGVFAQAPFVRIYGSVLCCEHVRGRGGCLFGGLEDESLCRHVPAVQARLMEINAGLVFWGGFGLISALFWVPVWRRYRKYLPSHPPWLKLPSGSASPGANRTLDMQV